MLHKKQAILVNMETQKEKLNFRDIKMVAVYLTYPRQLFTATEL